MSVSQNSDEFKCLTCQHKHCDDSNPASYIKWNIPNVIESNTCLLPMVTDSTETLLKIYHQYKNHIMPMSGGFLEQPNYVVESMGIIERAINE